MIWFYRKNISFVVPKEKNNMGAKEGRFVNLVMEIWSSCLLAAVFLPNFSNSVANSLSENKGSKRGVENLRKEKKERSWKMGNPAS